MKGVMDPNFDFDHLARDLTAEARGLTRMFFSTVHSDHEHLVAAMQKLFSDDIGDSKTASRRRARDFRIAMAGKPNLVRVRTWNNNRWLFVFALAKELRRNPNLPTFKISEPTIYLLSLHYDVGSPLRYKASNLASFSGHAIGRWFERAAPSDRRSSTGLIEEMSGFYDSDYPAIRIQGKIIRGDLGLGIKHERYGLPSVTTGGAWIASFRDIDVGLGNGLLGRSLFIHTYLGNAELSLKQIGNINALERFRNDNKHLLQTNLEEWPEEQLDGLTKVCDPAIWMPKDDKL
jgi:hypothetical protein